MGSDLNWHAWIQLSDLPVIMRNNLAPRERDRKDVRLCGMRALQKGADVAGD